MRMLNSEKGGGEESRTPVRSIVKLYSYVAFRKLTGECRDLGSPSEPPVDSSLPRRVFGPGFAACLDYAQRGSAVPR